MERNVCFMFFSNVEKNNKIHFFIEGAKWNLLKIKAHLNQGGRNLQ